MDFPMSAPPSTPFALRSLGGADKDTSPEEFLDFLRALIKEHLNDSARISASNSESWVGVIQGLSDHFLTPLPSGHESTWAAIGEKIQLVEITLEVLQRATVRVESLYGGRTEFAKHMFVRLLELSNSLDSWMDVVFESPNNLLTPSELRAIVFQGVVSLLRCLGNGVTTPNDSEEPTWKILRTIVGECIDALNGTRDDQSVLISP
jgi:serine/threonine-protein kinase ATR